MLYSGLLCGFRLVLSVMKTYVVECEMFLWVYFYCVDNVC